MGDFLTLAGELLEPARDPLRVLRWTTVIAAIGSAIMGLEVISGRAILRDDGILSWPIQRTRFPEQDRFGVLGSYPTFLLVPSLGIVASLGVLVALLIHEPLVAWLGPLAVVVLLTDLLLMFRQPHFTGAQTMQGLVWLGLALAWVQPTNDLALRLCLFFIAAQSLLSYCSNGWHKATIRSWQKGSSLPAFAHHGLFGNPFLARLTDRGLRLRWILISVIPIETAFPFAVFAGVPGFVFFVGWAVVFHLLNGFVMGLNHFITAYFATFPAILFSSILWQDFVTRSLS